MFLLSRFLVKSGLSLKSDTNLEKGLILIGKSKNSPAKKLTGPKFKKASRKSFNLDPDR